MRLRLEAYLTGQRDGEHARRGRFGWQDKELGLGHVEFQVGGI